MSEGNIIVRDEEIKLEFLPIPNSKLYLRVYLEFLTDINLIKKYELNINQTDYYIWSEVISDLEAAYLHSLEDANLIFSFQSISFKEGTINNQVDFYIKNEYLQGVINPTLSPITIIPDLPLVTNALYPQLVFTNETEVTIQHNLGKVPLVQIVVNNMLSEGEIEHIDLNTFVVRFNTPLSGTIIWSL